MNELQIPRGYLSARLNKGQHLLQGELFHDLLSNEIYIGTGSTAETNKVVKIGGDGSLSFIDEVSSLPVHPILNGVYYITSDISNNKIGQTEVGEYHIGDLAIAVPTSGVEASAGTTSGGIAVDFKWLRVKTGGGEAASTEFDVSFTNFAILKDANNKYVIKNVQEALVYADRNKLSFGETLIFPTITDPETSTVSYNYTPSKTELWNFGKLKAGHLYVVEHAATIEGVNYEIGDFVIVTSDVVTNNTALTANDIKLSRMAGGTHDASKIYLNANGTDLVRGNPEAQVIYRDTDAATLNVKDALSNLYTSKADLDPTTHKILLSELPDTITGGLDYQGTFNGGITVDVVGSSTTITGSWHLPTAADKSSVDTDGSITTNALVKGDYWVYNGEEHDISTFTNIHSTDGTLSSGDYIIYQGDGQWGVIDNVAPFTGISAGGNTLDQRKIILDGTVDFPDSSRGSVTDNNLTQEVTVTANETTNSINITTPSALLAKSNTFAEKNKIYKEDGLGLQVASGLTDDGETLDIQNSKRTIVIRDNTGTKTTTIVAQNELDETGSSSVGSNEITIKLPKESGTLARREDLGMSDGKENYVPAYNSEGSLVNSPVHIYSANNKNDAFAIAYDVLYDVDENVKYSAKLVMPSTPGKDGTGVTNVLPSVNGYLLNSQSIIDCGYWDENGNVSYPNEGKYFSKGEKTAAELTANRNNTVVTSIEYSV